MPIKYQPVPIAGGAGLTLIVDLEAQSEEFLAKIKGPQGDRGPSGPQGPEGPQGRPGDTGPVGKQGDLGTKGDQGDRGLVGREGKPGSVPAGVESLWATNQAIPDGWEAVEGGIPSNLWAALFPSVQPRCLIRKQ